MTAAPAMPESSRRSLLVTVVAWIAIAWSALATLGGLWELTILAVTPAATIKGTVSRVTAERGFQLLPPPYQFLAHHVYLVNAAQFLWWAAVLVVSIGALRRKEWGRRAFVAVLAVEIALTVAGVVGGWWIGIRMARQLAAEAPSGRVNPGLFPGFALGGLLGIGIVAILVWLLFAFRSARVRAECTPVGVLPNQRLEPTRP